MSRLRWAILTTSVVLVFGCAADAPEERRPTDSGAESAVAASESEGFSGESAHRLGEGFLVWESNRSGAWRIWTRRLDGSGLRRLTPDERGRQHCCAHISPDGRWVTYLSLAGGRKEYVGGHVTGELRVIRVDGSEETVIAEAARPHHESRAAVWVSETELVHITGDGRTRGVDISTGASRIVIDEPWDEYGWLLNSELTYATRGWPSFSPVRNGRIDEQAQINGCQPYFSHDGRWGFWSAGAGGPIHRIELASGEVSTILRKNDSRLPDDRGYLYFPMVSRDGRLFALGASKGKHDHFSADYEIYVFESDPRTLEVTGEPVRFTFDAAVDRFPDVWSEPLELGDYSGEAPFEVRLTAPVGEEDDTSWIWTFDGPAGIEAGEGERVARTFERPGIYRITATSGERSAAGVVRVAAAAPPALVRHELRGNGREVVLWFDERVDLETATTRFRSGLAIESSRAGDEGRSLVLRLADPVERPETLIVSGVADMAQHANRAGEFSVSVEPPLWPSREENLLLLWQTAEAANFVRHPESGAERAPRVQARGMAALDHDFALVMSGGEFLIDPESSETVILGVQSTHELTIELTLTPRGLGREGRVLGFTDSTRREIEIVHRDGALLFRLRTRGRGGRSWSPAVRLAAIESGVPAHLVVTYQPGRLRAYLDGELTAESDEVQGDFYRWEEGRVVVGTGWKGTVEGLALYGRVLPANEVHENAQRYASLRAERPVVERVVVEATRLRASKPPTLQEISPYREALVVHEYRIDTVIRGDLDATSVRVAEWAILGGDTRAASEGRVRLVLERFADNPQLEGTVLRDEIGGTGELYYSLP